jgi:hypothetical protein
MSTQFKQFLQEQASKHLAEAKAGKATVEEWRTSVEKLFANIREWLKESDSDAVIEIKETEEDVNEPGLGRYRVPRLDLRVFGKWVGVIPKARRTVGTAKPPRKSAPEQAQGRVDITDELRRFVLYRFAEGDRDVWVIDGLSDADVPRPFDQEAFEKALMSYIR